MNRILPAVLAGLALAGCESAPVAESAAPRADSGAPLQLIEPAGSSQAPESPAITTTGVAIPTGNRASSGLWIEKVAPTEVIAGRSFEYEIRATNLTDVSLDNVTVWDSMPAGFQMDSAEPVAQPGSNGLTWNLGMLGPRQTRAIAVRGTSLGTGPISGRAGGSYSVALCATVDAVQPELRLTRSAPAEVTGCDPMTTRLVVTNVGTGTARNVVVTEALPEGLSVEGRTTLVFEAGAIPAGKSRTFTYNARADRPGVFESGAEAAGDGGLKATSSRSATRVTQPALSVDIQGPDRLFVGRTVTYEVRVTNTGDTPAANTVVEAAIPPGAVFTTASHDGRPAGQSVVWNLGTLSAQEARTVTVSFHCPRVGGMRASATARAECAPAATAAVATDVAGIPALEMNGAEAPHPARVGDLVAYSFTIANQGSAPLTNVRLVCTLDEPGLMEFVSCKGDAAGASDGRTVAFDPVASLDPKESATMKVVVRAVAKGQMQLRAEASSDQITRPVVKVETTNIYD